MSTVRRATAAGFAAASLLVLAGCGGNDSAAKATDTSSASPSSSASASATSGDTSSASATADSSDSAAPSGGQSVSASEITAKMQTALDNATTAHMTLGLGSGLGSAEGDADYTQKPPSIDLTLDVQQLGGKVEVRMVKGVIYFQSPTLGAKWLKFDSSDPSNPLGSLSAELDPTKTLETYAKAVTSATYVGKETEGGQSLDHYTVTIDTSSIASDLPSALAGSASSLPATITQDWWFDSDGRIAKLTMDVESSPITITFTKWGEPVSIEAPPASDVTDASGLGG